MSAIWKRIISCCMTAVTSIIGIVIDLINDRLTDEDE